VLDIQEIKEKRMFTICVNVLLVRFECFENEKGFQLHLSYDVSIY
jgi:hypothetical protein